MEYSKQKLIFHRDKVYGNKKLEHAQIKSQVLKNDYNLLFNKIISMIKINKGINIY